mmetsp:Transcript_69364/g.115285  ORF Transcript_69364/g.115285 Transcript_69364/m.115285 type:complete len:218 (-) Transcript_69364:420-1073(-)
MRLCRLPLITYPSSSNFSISSALMPTSPRRGIRLPDWTYCAIASPSPGKRAPPQVLSIAPPSGPRSGTGPTSSSSSKLSERFSTHTHLTFFFFCLTGSGSEACESVAPSVRQTALVSSSAAALLLNCCTVREGCASADAVSVRFPTSWSESSAWVLSAECAPLDSSVFLAGLLRSALRFLRSFSRLASALSLLLSLSLLLPLLLEGGNSRRLDDFCP